MKSSQGKMENKWNFQGNGELKVAPAITIRGVLTMMMQNLNTDDQRPVIPLGHGDPSAFPCFRTAVCAEDAIVDSVRSGKFNCYSPSVGILPARRAVADYLSNDLPYELSPDDVYLTIGCTQAIEVVLAGISLINPVANILLPRPGFPFYDTRAACSNLEVRCYDLLPEKGWEVDLEALEALADENTVAMVIINPGNPCGNVYTSQHLKKIAETARKLGIVVIADEVYDHLTFANNPFVPMGTYGSIAPVLTLGSISKRWLVPGWRLGWLVTCDPNAFLQNSGLMKSIKGCLDVAPDAPTFIQAAIPQIIENTKQDFFLKTVEMLRSAADICFDKLNEIPCIMCPSKPEGSMFVMVKLNFSLLDDISDDVEFSLKLAKEESVIVLPGVTVGLKNWLRITFACDHLSLQDGLGRIKAFCERHAKKQ
ncbi:tyrosine aminotransferase-like [Argentina anserina]|uniref:tyrosine aminotransferase-like n=1 Tax=Argentina anserina TaxID=57926 RepID=UPI0021766D97|nr:tyrosine aminotransferase-like [Potentilla anserina]XP_050379351.1 tyrosine aminotransferase-like [Potentilla anserina]XP_050379352.1 tyrosine aminotransferase-like [Potentilla anserina]XP_050379353.1 tyrosine aminotransferase-like [Potentilla anserina]